MAKVVIGLSGGVDSSVAAYLLKEQGHDVIALFMVNWHDKTGLLEGDCPWDNDLNFAKLVARKLDIPLHVVDLSKEYRSNVVDYMFDEYSKGRTPNPDVLCNREIKFDVFLKKALEYGDYVATGHYCRKEEVTIDGKTYYRLLAGKDDNKDQSYFLCQLSQAQLEKALFPIGDIEKPEVRRIAAEARLASATKKDSQGICFVGKVDLPTFLQQKLKAIPGKVVEIENDYYNSINNDFEFSDTPSTEELMSISAPFIYNKTDGEIIGDHTGAHFFTIGQRKGLNIGGKVKPLFVIGTDINENMIYTGQGQDHPGLYRRGLFIPNKEIHLIRPDQVLPIGDYKDMLVRIRYRQPLQNARLYMRPEGLFIVFRELQRGITAGQFAAWYENEELIGSGVID